jgi:predicted RND superfamily exporter protein
LLNKTLIEGDREYTPSLDRIDSKKGYTPDNVWVISHRANQIKNDATIEELKLITENLEKLK